MLGHYDPTRHHGIVKLSAATSALVAGLIAVSPAAAQHKTPISGYPISGYPISGYPLHLDPISGYKLPHQPSRAE